MTNHIEATRVVVIGGGYAGTLAANHLQTRADVDVALVNPRGSFVERIRLHQLVAGSSTATVDYATMLHPNVRLVVDTAIEIDAAGRRVALASGGELRYDYLVYAVGSTAATGAVPGAAEFAYPIAEYEHAQRLRSRVDDLHPNAPVCVVGGGLTGIEAAAELAEQRAAGTVTLICGAALGPSLSEPGRRSVARQLARLGVQVLEGSAAAEVRDSSVVLDDGSEVPSAVTVWTAGFGVPDLAAASGLRTDTIGRLLTDETLTSVDDDRIVAAGDAAAPSDQPLRMSCQAAGPLGAQAANTVLSRIAGAEPDVVNQAFAGQCISLGRSLGTVVFAHSDDTPRRIYIGGRTAAAIKELVCKGTVKFIAREARRPGSYFWLRGGKRPAPTPVEVS
ncbi:NAD(P)/FAD-dependent oxidoreductase [Mycobacterium sp.]|uniref:NAD(P)/FAD-dependent oxidoreductase n=1 Tax=Mycobacterium sp. TaxID=1785 RepID=UPI002B5BEEAA|nr:FAD-dependent oxidoreductase [Mycobacterium sp.]HME50540.1 FAD-dependent oxidoreductase [Mycobacterium sp.]